MRFEKVIIDGVEYYRMVEDGSATDKESCGADGENAENKGESADGKNKFCRDAEQFFERMSAGAKDFGEKFDKGAREFGDKFSKGAKDFGEKLSKGVTDLRDKIASGVERLFNADKSDDPNSLDARLIKLLPYMSGDELRDICERILKDDEAFEDLDLGNVMPFLPAETCDAFFLKALETEKDAGELLSAVPFVSDSCMSQVTDAYIAGEYPRLEIDMLYPFMSDENIKKIFYHIVGDKK